MQRTSLSSSLSVALLFAASSTSIAAENYAMPLEQHEKMAHDVGVWDADVSIWMEPDAEPISSKAVEKNEMLGKMWLKSRFEGEFGGEKFVGESALGYNPIKKKYVGGWIDSMSPFMMSMEGDYDESSHTLTMLGEGTDVMTGKSAKHKMVTQYESDDEKTFTMYRQDDDDNEWVKTMEIKYTRRQ